jgi:hypothetical protein
MPMQINKFKLIRILSNGSIYFIYKTYDNLEKYKFTEKDNLNFIFNLKKNNSKLIEKNFSKFKGKYFIT